MQRELTPTARLDAIDWLRGLVMVIMMLDHTRDFVHRTNFVSGPLDPATTTIAVYLTRWITHLCAPAFVLLAGVAAGLQAERERSQYHATTSTAKFLLSRGAWLVMLELTIIQFLISFTWNRMQIAYLQVIWAIGINMMLLAAMAWMPRRAIGWTGVAIIAGHNLLDRVQVPVWNDGSATPTVPSMLWQVVHQAGFFPIDTPATTFVFAGYPLLPWTGILFAGYGVSALFGWEPVHRRRTLTRVAIGMASLFLALRATHSYGDPLPWTTWPTLQQTVMDFFDVQKYGPSLQFTLITLAPSFLLLSWATGHALHTAPHRALVTLGRVPLFFYLLQWLFAHLAGIIVTAAQGVDIAPYFLNGNQQYYYWQQHGPARIGGPLWLVYLCWVAGIVTLYPLCRWYAGVKARRKDLVLLRYL